MCCAEFVLVLHIVNKAHGVELAKEMCEECLHQGIQGKGDPPCDILTKLSHHVQNYAFAHTVYVLPFQNLSIRLDELARALASNLPLNPDELPLLLPVCESGTKSHGPSERITNPERSGHESVKNALFVDTLPSTIQSWAQLSMCLSSPVPINVFHCICSQR